MNPLSFGRVPPPLRRTTEHVDNSPPPAPTARNATKGLPEQIATGLEKTKEALRATGEALGVTTPFQTEFAEIQTKSMTEKEFAALGKLAIKRLLNPTNMAQEGLFRVPGSVLTIEQMLKADPEIWEIGSASGLSANDYASFLKALVRTLTRDGTNIEVTKIQEVRAMLCDLRNLLLELPKYEQQNKMTPDNVAICTHILIGAMVMAEALPIASSDPVINKTCIKMIQQLFNSNISPNPINQAARTKLEEMGITKDSLRNLL